ncbi:endonuclease/exonuclease/phosphatase family protein, partial [bacterium]|nr:endonuclease/exonuclease/phosphatase family protein [candidate division CSSED10-310 bacterium]
MDSRLVRWLTLLAWCFLAGIPELRAETITIMAANLSSGDHQSYEAPGIRIFQGLQPDVVLIQEFSYESGSLDELVETAFGSDYTYMIETGNETIPNGIVSRFPIIDSGEWEDPLVPDRDFAWAIIDIPGNIHLQCISVHFKADSGSSGIRAQEAQAILNHIAAAFDPLAYIVIGGDLNTRSLDEQALSILETELAVSAHVPMDQNGNRNTSEPRTKPYDWCIPNDVLNSRHAPLVIGASIYPDGLVFDSAVYTPLTEVSPVQTGDSHVNGMQHMAVMKAFEVSTTPPTT